MAKLKELVLTGNPNMINQRTFRIPIKKIAEELEIYKGIPAHDGVCFSFTESIFVQAALTGVPLPSVYAKLNTDSTFIILSGENMLSALIGASKLTDDRALQRRLENFEINLVAFNPYMNTNHVITMVECLTGFKQ